MKLQRVTNALQWRHNGCDGISNHQPHDCLLNLLFRCRSKKTSKLRVTGLCAGNSPVTGEFPAQRASNAENVSIWCHHGSSVSVALADRVTTHHLQWCELSLSSRENLIVCWCINYYEAQTYTTGTNSMALFHAPHLLDRVTSLNCSLLIGWRSDAALY